MFQKKNKISKDVLYAAYIGFAIGDALGVPAEFLPRKELLKQPIVDMIGGGFHHREPGVWSDDTSLMLANSHSLAVNGFFPESMAKDMVSWMDYGTFSATGEPFGIGNGIRKSLERFKAGFLPTEAGGRSTFENGNGALMRILPLAFYLYNCRSTKKRKKIIYDCCSITHYHELSKITCHFYVEFLICLLKTKDFQKSYKETARRFRKTTNRKEFERLFSNELFLLRKSDINSGSFVISTLEAALWTIANTKNYEEAVLMAVNLGYDADTVAAITGGIAGILYGKEQIPKRWISKLKGKETLEKEVERMYKNINAAARIRTETPKERLLVVFKTTALHN